MVVLEIKTHYLVMATTAPFPSNFVVVLLQMIK
jgi:hypothetical protein